MFKSLVHAHLNMSDTVATPLHFGGAAPPDPKSKIGGLVALLENERDYSVEGEVGQKDARSQIARPGKACAQPPRSRSRPVVLRRALAPLGQPVREAPPHLCRSARPAASKGSSQSEDGDEG